MPRYRLIADHGHPFDAFTAEDDRSAERTAREMAERAPTAKGTGYRLETGVEGGWQVVRAWVPRRVAAFPGGLAQTVPPPS